MKFNKLFILLMAMSLTGCSLIGNSQESSNDSGKEQETNNNNTNNNSQGNNNNGDNNSNNNNGNNDNNTNTNPDDNTTTGEARMQDTPILHCWNWSMTNISNNLQSIKDAGFKTIQLSPMQPQKDYYNGNSVKDAWWKLYQPLGFSVATKDNQIGTKSELTSMCTKAKSLGIDVIVDVVANHLANIDEKNNESDGTPKVKPEVANYEPYIYEHRNDAENPTFHHNPKATGSGAITQFYGYGGLPDLNTSHSKVQERVTSLLKEYIDCGVNGFRFDAAKHIETPEDPQYPSDFWKNVLGNTTTYATGKGLEKPYYYGEILNSPEGGRSFSLYTKYMCTIDSNQGSAVLSAVKNGDISKIKGTYNSGVKPSQLVLWAESHDTYANGGGESQGVSQALINKAYAIQTSRKDAASLYLARCSSDKMSDTLGNIGSTSYKNAEIKAVNNFHNEFVGKSENVSTNNNCFINVRGGQGAVIVDITKDSRSSVTVSASGLANGTYTDIVNNKKYTISSSSVSVTLTNGISVLVNDSKTSEVPPTLSLSANKEAFSGSTSVNVNATGATSITYSINNGSSTTLNGTSIEIPSSTANGQVIVKVVATNQYGSVSKTITLYKLATATLVNKSLILYNIDSNYSYFVWAWGGTTADAWYNPTYDNGMVGFDLKDSNKFIVVKFKNGTDSADWNSSNKVNQTVDVDLDHQVYDYSQLAIKTN